MTLRIGHSAEAMRVHRSLVQSSDRISKSIERLSSGLRINRAADDAAGLGISERMRGQIRGMQQANRNIQDGISMLQVMDGALAEVHSILQRARELAVQWGNGVLSLNDYTAIQAEMDALSNEIGRIEDTTQFNGRMLLQDATAIMTLQVGANNGETISFNLVDLMGPALQLVRPNTFASFPGLPADITGFDMHINEVSTARARLGAIQNRLEHAHNANSVTIENLMNAESRIRDVDFAQEMVELTKNQVIQQAASTMLIFAAHQPKRLLDLFQG